MVPEYLRWKRLSITAVHELIDYLRHDDIQALDEAEFAGKVKELIFEARDSFPF